jgi:hypothetical protein
VVSGPIVGDFFLLPLDGERVALAQVFGAFRKNSIHVAVFDPPAERESFVSIEPDHRQSRVVLVGLVMDEYFRNGRWPVIGRAPVAPHIPLPVYKMMDGRPDRYVVVDYSNALERPASAEEVERLPNRVTASAALFEGAVRAHFGCEPWQERYDKYRPDLQLTASSIFGAQEPLL